MFKAKTLMLGLLTRELLLIQQKLSCKYICTGIYGANMFALLLMEQKRVGASSSWIIAETILENQCTIFKSEHQT